MPSISNNYIEKHLYDPAQNIWDTIKNLMKQDMIRIVWSLTFISFQLFLNFYYLKFFGFDSFQFWGLPDIFLRLSLKIPNHSELLEVIAHKVPSYKNFQLLKFLF